MNDYPIDTNNSLHCSGCNRMAKSWTDRNIALYVHVVQIPNISLSKLIHKKKHIADTLLIIPPA